MRKLLTLTAAAAMVAVFGFAGAAQAGISVSKAITGIDADNNGSFEITDGAAIAAFLANFPNTTAIGLRVVFTVESIDSQVLTSVVVTDRFGAEYDATCGTASQGGCSLETKGNSEKEFLTWTVGALAADASATLEVLTETDVDPGGDQEYTECGEHEFNSGPTAKGRVAKVTGRGLRQVSDDGAQILITVSGFVTGGLGVDFPQCSNCFDDDDDGDIDLADSDCVDENDDDESS